MPKLKAIVKFDYDAEAEDELTLRVGDVLTNIKEVEDGWCKGVLKGKTGVFPDNFVEIEEDKSAVVKAAAPKPKKEPNKLMKVTFAYEPQGDDELKLEVGDIIEFLQDEEEGWAKGRLKGKEGAFPTNFCEAVSKKDVASPTIHHEETNGEVATAAAPKKVKGFGFGNIFDKEIKLKKSVSDVESDKPKAQTATKGKSDKDKAANAEKKTKVVEKYRVTHEYQAQSNDELSLKTGDIITIINKNTDDPGWWEGESITSAGVKKRGMFPDNFVVVLPPVDEGAHPVQKSKSNAEEKKIAEEKSKPKHSTTDKVDLKSNKQFSALAKAPSTNKRPAPQAPQSAPKTTTEDLDGITELSEEKQLTHYKRPNGPKNRRKPDAAGRRKRAKEAPEELIIELELEGKSQEPEKTETDATTPHVVPKKKTFKGVPVMPTLPGGGTGAGASEAGDTPNWLKQLKSRASLKQREPAALSVATKKAEDSPKAPDYLAHIRKNPKPDESAPVPAKPHLAFTPTKNIGHFNSLKNCGVAPPQADRIAATESSEKAKSFKVFQKSKSEADVLANNASEQVEEAKTEPKPAEVAKKMPPKPQAALHPPALPVDKRPPPATKPKPPPTKAKPTVPLSKPSFSSPSMEDLKEEVKSLKELFHQYQSDHQKKINRLNEELEAEKKQRSNLEAEIVSLKKRIG